MYADICIFKSELEHILIGQKKENTADACGINNTVIIHPKTIKLTLEPEMSLHLGSKACIAFVIEIIYKKVQSLNITHYHAKSACTFTHALYYCLYSQ